MVEKFPLPYKSEQTFDQPSDGQQHSYLRQQFQQNFGQT